MKTRSKLGCPIVPCPDWLTLLRLAFVYSIPIFVKQNPAIHEKNTSVLDRGSLVSFGNLKFPLKLLNLTIYQTLEETPRI